MRSLTVGGGVVFGAADFEGGGEATSDFTFPESVAEARKMATVIPGIDKIF